MQDALDFFWTWYATGPDSHETKASVNRLNKLHFSVAKKLPGHFENSDDFIYVLARLVVLPDRLLKKLGLSGIDPQIKLAQFNFAKALSKHFRREGDKELEGFPEKLEELEDFVDGWEGKNHVYSPVLTDLVLVLIYAFGERWFPKPLHTLRRWIGIYYDEDPWPDYSVDAVLPVGVGGERDIGAMVLHGRRQPASVPDGGQLVGVYFNTPPLANMSDEEIKHRAIEQVHNAFGEAPRPRFVHLFRYEKGLTIAKPGHYGSLDKVHELLPPNIRLAGDYFSQAGVEAAVYSGEHAAKSLSK
ncbi:MAG: FAD-dependent oxidoreductase [Gammaproteobacteria bacterium]